MHFANLEGDEGAPVEIGNEGVTVGVAWVHRGGGIGLGIEIAGLTDAGDPGEVLLPVATTFGSGSRCRDDIEECRI